MRCIFGIGNPGERYKNNRHNVGFMFLDYFAEKHSLSFKPSKFDFYFSKEKVDSSEFVLIKPSTYVNNSGVAAFQIINQYEINTEDFLVVVDDINMETGNFRLRKSGGDGGHNGMASIIYHLHTENFPRLRIGVGNKFEKGEMASYVLTNFNKSDKKNLENIFIDNYSLVKEFITGGTKKMFDAYSKFQSNKNLENNSNKD